LKKDGRYVAGAQVLFRSAALGIVKIGYIPHGPLVDWEDEEQVHVLFSQIDQSAYDHGAGILKMEPLLWQKDLPQSTWSTICEREQSVITADTIQPPRTIMVDLRPSADEIMAAMKSKTRYNIRLSARKGVTVREGSADDIPIFNRLMIDTGQRDSFGTHAPEYYRDAFQLFAPQNATLLIAEYEGRPLAASFITAFGKTGSYLYGASGNEERNRMPTYAVQWAAMRWAKERGCTQYDLWGIPDAEEEQLEAEFTERGDGLWPIYRAKRGYGGRIQRTVGAADRVYNQRLYRLYKWRRSR
jgi:lipid II:glycine glycyltransferase (peptidoglycan interpeptide bridge formation enzyme)